MAKKLTPNLISKLISRDEILEFFITTNEGEQISFHLKSNLNLSEMRFIVDRTVEIIIELSETKLATELKKTIFYTLLIETLSKDFCKLRVNENETEIYDFERMYLFLNKIGFEYQLRSEDINYRQFYDTVCQMLKLINEKIDYFKEKQIHNSELIKNINKIVVSLQSIPEIIEKFTNSIDGIDKDDIQTLIAAFKTLNTDNNLGSLADNVVKSYLNKQKNNNDDTLNG